MQWLRVGMASKRAGGKGSTPRRADKHTVQLEAAILIKLTVHVCFVAAFTLAAKCDTCSTPDEQFLELIQSTCPLCVKTSIPKLKLLVAPLPAIKVNRKIWMKSIP